MTSTRTLSSPRRALGSWLAALALVAACTADDPADDSGNDTSSSEGSTESAATAGTDAPASDASTSAASTTDAPEPGTTDSGDGSTTDDAGQAELGAIAGSITRTAEPSGPGIGTVYVAVFADNPITNMGSPTLGQAVLADADMSDPTTVLVYLIEDLPVRPEPYHVVAFLDDDGNASMDAPGPDMGDLVTLDGTGAPTVVVTPGDPVPMNLVLNAVMPF